MAPSLCWFLTAVGSQLIRHDDVWISKAFHLFSQEFQCDLAISPLGDKGFQHLAFVIDSPPQGVHLAVDFHKNLIQVQ
jgi:hypothetical protein